MQKLMFVLAMVCIFAGVSFSQKSDISNPAIDMEGFLKISADAARHRETRRLTEDEFIAKSREPGVMILDARSKEKYDQLHIKGSVNLSFPDITIESLGLMFPVKNVTILIYCNNNFKNAEEPFPAKMAKASLNLSTYISLYTYGYRNIYELGPLLDLRTSKFEFESRSIGTASGVKVN